MMTATEYQQARIESQNYLVRWREQLDRRSIEALSSLLVMSDDDVLALDPDDLIQISGCGYATRNTIAELQETIVRTQEACRALQEAESHRDADDAETSEEFISLRDFFAVHAMSGLLAYRGDTQGRDEPPTDVATEQVYWMHNKPGRDRPFAADVAEQAYLMADAMLEARDK